MIENITPEIGQTVKALRVRGAEGNNGVIGEVIIINPDGYRFTIKPKEGPTWIVRTAADEWAPHYEGDDIVGKHVKVTNGSPARLVGMTGTITSTYLSGGDLWAYMAPDSGFEKGPHEGGGWIIYGWDFLHTSHGETEDETVRFIRERDEKIEELEKALKDANDRVAELRDRPQEIVTCIGQHLIAAAIDNDMCSVYDEEVDDANTKLSKWGVALPLRHSEYEVEMIEYVKVGVRRTFTVSAINEEAAKDAAQSDADDSKLTDDDVIEAIRSYADPQFDEYSSRYDWSVTLV